MRVLHLIDSGKPGAWIPGCWDAVLGACRILREHTPHEHAVCVVGSARLEADARRCGLGVAGRISPPLGEPWFAARALQRLAAAQQPPDIVHCWSPALAPLARRALPGPRVCATFLDPAPRDAEIARRAARSIGPAPVAVCSDAARDEWTAAGLDPARVEVVAPPVRTDAATPSQRVAVRRALALAPAEIAVLMVGSAPYADAVRFVLMHGILGINGTHFTGLLTRETGQFARGIRYFLSAPPKNRLIVSDHACSRLLPGMDLAVFDGGGYGPSAGLAARPAASTMPIAAAHAAGVPVIGPAWAGDPRLYPPDTTAALLGHNGAVLEIARVLPPIVADPDLRITLARRVREHIEALRPDAQFASAISTMWTGDPGAPDRQPPRVEVRPPQPQVAAP